MSLAALPLTIIPFILYNLLMIMGVDLSTSLVGDGITMMSGGVWKLTWGDVLLLIGIVVLFIEIVKATYTGTASMIDHGLSMVVFIAFLVEFLMVSQAAVVGVLPAHDDGADRCHRRIYHWHPGGQARHWFRRRRSLSPGNC